MATTPERHDIDALLQIMARLRDRRDGCPWDLQQDFSSIAPYTIEEAYEVAEAIAHGDMDELKDELGDLLLQVVFHAQMASEQGAFDFHDVVAAIAAKLVRRHPHVFAQVQADDAASVGANWDAIKQRERQARGQDDPSALAGVPRGLPEWQRALKLLKRAARAGFDWGDPQPVLAKLREEVDEVAAELAAPASPQRQQRLEDELGDVLFVCTSLARHAGVDPGAALRSANRKFERRFRAMEALADAAGATFSALPLAQQEALWAQVKRDEVAAGPG